MNAVPRTALALCLALLLPAGAMAQAIDQDGAQTLQQTLQSWFAGLLGPNLGATASTLRVTAEDDHFRVVLPFTDAAGDNEVSADVKPLDGGRWSVDALHLPSATSFNLQLPQPGGAPGAQVPTKFALRIGTQASSAVLDPGFATASRLDVDLGNLGMVTDSTGQHQEQHIDRYVMHNTLEPRDGRLDLIHQGTLTGWRSASLIGGMPAVAFGADRIQAHGWIDGIDRDHAGALLTAAGGLLATLPPAATLQHGDAALSAPARAALRTLLEATSGIITGMRGEETIDGLHIAVAGQGEGTVRQVRLGLEGAAPGGMLHAALDIGLDGMAAQNMPVQAMSLVPRHLELRPSISGVSLAGLTALALEATDQTVDQAKVQADALGLLTHGGVTVGLDALELNAGPAELSGHGHVLVSGPDAYQAAAHITATGLDDLIKQVSGDPSMQQAVVFLALARGFAKPEGDHLVWDIRAGQSGLMINGVPLSIPKPKGHQGDKR